MNLRTFILIVLILVFTVLSVAMTGRSQGVVQTWLSPTDDVLIDGWGASPETQPCDPDIWCRLLTTDGNQSYSKAPFPNDEFNLILNVTDVVSVGTNVTLISGVWALKETNIGLSQIDVWLYDGNENCTASRHTLSLRYTNYTDTWSTACDGTPWTETRVNDVQVWVQVVPAASDDIRVTMLGVSVQEPEPETATWTNAVAFVLGLILFIAFLSIGIAFRVPMLVFFGGLTGLALGMFTWSLDRSVWYFSFILWGIGFVLLIGALFMSGGYRR